MSLSITRNFPQSGGNGFEPQCQKDISIHCVTQVLQSSTSPPRLPHEYRNIPLANLLAGGVGGLCSIVVGQPLDTVKVKLQTMVPVLCPTSGAQTFPYSGGLDCFKHCVKSEGFLSLFRGMSGLALFAVPRSALLFYANSLGRNLVKDPSAGNTKLTVTQILFGGVLSQLLIAPTIVSPMERIKVMLQTDPHSYSGQIGCLRHILNTEGIAGLTKGSFLTLCRDLPSFCTYFLTYEHLRSRMIKDESDKLSLLQTASIGAIAGILAWSVAIPVDGLKTRFQAASGNSSVIVLLRSLRNNGGLLQLYRGAGVVLLRAGPTNAATFVGYEWTLRGISWTSI